MTSVTSPATVLSQLPALDKAWEMVEEEVQKVTEPSPIILDVPTAVTTGLGVWPRLWSMRDEIIALPHTNVQQFDKLPLYILATAHAHGVYKAAESPQVSLEEAVQSGTELFGRLNISAQMLAKHGLIPEHRLKGLDRPVGHKNLAFGLITLRSVFMEMGDAVYTTTPLKPDDMERAQSIAQTLLAGTAIREHSPAVVAAASKSRQRAFTLYLKAYDQARRAVTYLRWDEGDADDIAPSLYAGRGNSNVVRKKGEPKQDESAAASENQPEAQPAQAPAAFPPGHPEASPFAE